MSVLPSVCPLDCPAACSLDIQLDENGGIKNINGHKSHPFTKGIICKKVKNFKQRLDHPKRIIKPFKRVGAKGSAPDGGNQFVEIELAEALDILVDRFARIKDEFGAEAIWPYNYAGTMGWCQRDGINRLNHRFGFSQMKGTFCINAGNAGWKAGVGAMLGVDALECYEARQIVIWGQNTQVTQIPLMAHFLKARAQNKSKIIVIDVYETATMKLADEGYIIKPGSDGALALGLMNYILKQGWHDCDYLKQYTDFNQETYAAIALWPLEKTAQHTGLTIEEIKKLASDYAQEPQTILRMGYGLTRHRAGATNLHAASCLPALVGHWKHKGGGALWSQSGHVAHLDKSIFSGSELGSTGRILDQSLIGKVLNGELNALKKGDPVQGMIIQNTNPAAVAANTSLVRKGFLRTDLFTCVHELFMTDTARYADLIIPATAFIEHNDIYSQGGWHWLHIGPSLRKSAADCIENHELINHLARMLGATEATFKRSAKEQVQYFLDQNHLGQFDDIVSNRGISFERSFDEQHFLGGFPTEDKKFHFHPNWPKQGAHNESLKSCPYVIDNHADCDIYNYRLVIPPKEDRLNSTFSEIYTGEQKGQSMPVAMLSENTLSQKGYKALKGEITLYNKQGEVSLAYEANNKVAKNTIIIEGVFPKWAFIKGHANDLVYDTPSLPDDGLCVHDIAVDFFVQ